MCGIMGYYCFGSKKPDKNKIANMFQMLESRGKDSSGFALLNEENNLIVHKAPVGSTAMIKSREWKETVLPKIMILHTRMKTQGSEKNNANNHPLFSKSGIAIVHNGIIYNDKEIFGRKERDAEVDSEAILMLLSLKTRGDKLKRIFDRIEGSFAVAVIDKNNPAKLILIKKDNPIDMYFDSADDILYFCSERYIMQESLLIKSKSSRGFNLGEDPYHYYEMKNNHALVINKDGVESYQRYFPRRDIYFSRYNDDEMTIECPWCNSRTRLYDGKLYNKCEECGMEISEEELYNV